MAEDQVVFTASRSEALQIQALLRALSRLSVSGDLTAHLVPGMGLCLGLAAGSGRVSVPRAAALELARMRVQSVGNDHLVCRIWDGATSGTLDIPVAKPPELRRTGWHGATLDGITYTYSSGYQRSATDGVDTEDQVIGPPYTVSGGSVEILALRPALGTGGLGVTFNDAAVEWIDLNLAARRWEVECE
jgi:hypothetical protein